MGGVSHGLTIRASMRVVTDLGVTTIFPVISVTDSMRLFVLLLKSGTEGLHLPMMFEVKKLRFIRFWYVVKCG